ncbi:centrosomal protein of 290 kDa-like [Oscarella lobularis]|uniref:centrosomal protein of 290 kDa-like n=1 Tax=Oscarella lobularis TaxID=121494 RepID=UPI0033141FDE
MSRDIAVGMEDDSGWLAPLLDSPSRFFSSTVQTGRELKTRLQSWITSSFDENDDELLTAAEALESDSAETKEVLESVSVALRRQHEINRETTQLARVNFVANLANIAKHKQIEGIISEGQKSLRRMNSQLQIQTSKIQLLNGRVSGLKDEVDSQKKVSSRLEKDLRQQTELLQSSIQESRRDIERQQSILDKQQQVVNKLAKDKMKADFFVDAGLCGFAVFVANTFLVDLPLKLVLSPIPKENLQKWLRQLVKLVLMWKMVTYLRSILVRYGLHGKVGSTSSYAEHAMELIVSVLQKATGHCATRWSNWRTPAKKKKTPAKSTGMDVC